MCFILEVNARHAPLEGRGRVEEAKGEKKEPEL